MNKNKIPISIVIPSIGEELLFDTLEKLNEGNFIIDEILIIIPKNFISLILLVLKIINFILLNLKGK